MRKILTTLLAAAALTAAAAQPAQAACSNWQPDTDNGLIQGNGYHGGFQYYGGYWHAELWSGTGSWPLWGDVMFSSWTKDLVKFTITWSNKSAGIYTGSIDANGFVSGTAEDRWTHATTTWRFRDVAICRG